MAYTGSPERQARKPVRKLCAKPHAMYTSIDPAKVEVHSVQPPDKSFVDVGVFQLDDSLHPEAGAIEELRKQGVGKTFQILPYDHPEARVDGQSWRHRLHS